jgi:GNAT superfamily N-acetyltransferase
MPAVEVRASGRESLSLATRLLQRARLADPEAGIWEAADIQWWWRTPRRSDRLDQLYWFDADGPMAAVLLTDWGESWGCDPLLVPGAAEIGPDLVWAGALEQLKEQRVGTVDVVARDDDHELAELLSRAGFDPTEGSSGITWMNAEDRPAVAPMPPGFELADRTDPGGAHPMSSRSGPDVEARLLTCSLYDPSLDLAIRSEAGDTVAYALFWFDPVTRVGLVEPMRVEDEFQRRGLGRGLLSAGLDRLARRGARRFKVGFGTDPARALYLAAGFRVSTTMTSWRRQAQLQAGS